MTQYQLNLLKKYNLDPSDPYDDYYTPKDFQRINNIIELWKLGRKGRGQKGGRTAIVKQYVLDLMKFKQFQRTQINNNYQHPEKGWNSLKQDIFQNGIKQPLIIQIGKDGKAKITQGNHRLGICQQLKIKQVPVVFQFVNNVYNGIVAENYYNLIKTADTYQSSIPKKLIKNPQFLQNYQKDRIGDLKTTQRGSGFIDRFNPNLIKRKGIKFINYLKSRPDLKVKLYHGTGQQYLGKINQKGFTPPTFRGVEGVQLRTKGRDVNFYTSSTDYAIGSYASRVNSPVLLQVQIPLYMIVEVQNLALGIQNFYNQFPRNIDTVKKIIKQNTSDQEKANKIKQFIQLSKGPDQWTVYGLLNKKYISKIINFDPNKITSEDQVFIKNFINTKLKAGSLDTALQWIKKYPRINLIYWFKQDIINQINFMFQRQEFERGLNYFNQIKNVLNLKIEQFKNSILYGLNYLIESGYVGRIQDVLYLINTYPGLGIKYQDVKLKIFDQIHAILNTTSGVWSVFDLIYYRLPIQFNAIQQLKPYIVKAVQRIFNTDKQYCIKMINSEFPNLKQIPQINNLINNNMKKSNSWYSFLKQSDKSLYQQIKDYPKVKYLKGIGAIDLDPNLAQVKQIVNDRRYGNSALQQSEFNLMIENIQNSYRQLGNPQFFPRHQMPVTNKIQYQQVLPKILQSRKKILQPKIQSRPVQVKPDIEVRNTFNSKPTPKPVPFGTRLNLPKI